MAYPPQRVLGQWRQPLESWSGWTGVDGAGLLSLGDALYRLGGWNPIEFSPSVINHVYKSTNRGQSWTRLADPPWPARHSAGWLTFGGHLWVIGGDTQLGDYQKDVWRGTPNGGGGIDWVQVATNAAPLSMGRILHVVFANDRYGKMFLVGGQTHDESATTPANRPGGPYYDDCWSSSDGATWTKVSEGHAWAPCGSIIGNATLPNGNMFLIGGGAYETEGNPRIVKNTVYRSIDGGVTWPVLNASAAFPACMYNCVAVLGESLVTFAGYSTMNLSHMYASENGSTWRNLGNITGAARHAASVATHFAEIYTLGGPMDDTSVRALS